MTTPQIQWVYRLRYVFTKGRNRTREEFYSTHAAATQHAEWKKGHDDIKRSSVRVETLVVWHYPEEAEGLAEAQAAKDEDARRDERPEGVRA